MSNTMFNASDYKGSGPENYEKYFVPTIAAPLADDLVDIASLRHGERVLDVACGTGVVARLAAAQVGNEGSVAGLDVNPGMLSVARSATPSNATIDWYETSVEAMPLPDGAFDVILCQMGLQFVPNKIQALKEIRRLLDPGGRVVLNFPGPTPRLFAVLGDVLAQHIDPKCTGFVNVVFSMHDGEELRGLMMDAGFEDIEAHQTERTLRLPEPEDFLWQYIHSTPLAALVGKANEEQRAALTDDVCARWQEFVIDGGMNLDIRMTTVRGYQPQ
ncbi:MAG: class I SAM-dependent methyltransferase [Granulosicoccus sp.]|nr:class I SAM-dependent methyltransferase [Granulosicoccus sp.]